MVRWRRVSLGCAALALIAPTVASSVFNGIPTDSLPELIALGALVLLFLDTSKKPVDAREIARSKRIITLALLTVILKTVLYLASPTSGQFEVCYHHFDEPADESCIPTFEPHPILAARSEWFPSRSTQIKEINFGPRVSESGGLSASNWRLPQVNSFRYDQGFWPWVDNDRRIEVFPFRAEFAGKVSVEKGDTVRITYVGQGNVVLNEDEFDLPAAYDSPGSVDFTVPEAGSSLLTLGYAFLRTQPNSETTVLPYAMLHVEKLSDSNRIELTPRFSFITKAATSTIDALTILTILFVILLLRREALVGLLSLPLGLIFWMSNRYSIEIALGPARFELSTVLLTLLLLGVALRKWRWQVTLFPILALSYHQVSSEIQSATGVHAFANQVLIRLRGNDHLVYHSLVREMLNSGFLRGGEDVFYFQPGIRYVFYVQSLIFGESSVIVGAFNVAVLGFGIVAVVTAFRSNQNRSTTAIQVLSVFSLLMWWTSSHTTQSVIFGLSEFGTWILVLYIFALLLRPMSSMSRSAIGFMAAAVIWIRPNQGLAMLVIILLVHITESGSVTHRLKRSSPCTGVFLAVVSLIPIHNFLIGRRIALLPGGHLNADQRPWLTLFNALTDQSSRTFVLDQFRALLYLPSVLSDIYSSRLGLAFAMFGVLWTSAILMKLRSPRASTRYVLFAVGLVIAQVAPFFKYTLIRYYPIHLIAIYLSLALTTIFLTNSPDGVNTSPNNTKASGDFGSNRA